MLTWLTADWVIGAYQRVLLIWVGFATGWGACWLAPRLAAWWVLRRSYTFRRLRIGVGYLPRPGDSSEPGRSSSKPPPLPREQDSAAVWECKVGRFGVNGALPDSDMRDAVWEAFMRLTGKPPHFCFSGWGSEQLTSDELELAHEHARAREPESLQ